MISFHALIKSFIKFSLRLYFHKVKVEGLENVPRNTPLIVTPNHQNSFLDALLVGAFLPIPLYYLTRSDVFTWWTKPILRLLHMMPIYRIRDGYSKLSLNDAIFDSCRELFDEHKSVLIFAEGNHGEHHYLRPLTKGAARLAIQSQQQMDEDLMVQPVGLNFFDHQSPKSVVLIKFGKPIPVKEYLEEYKKNQAQGLIKIREAMSEGMKSTLVIPGESPDHAQQVKAIFQRKHEGFSFQELKSIDPSGVVVDESRKKKKHILAWMLNLIPLLIIKQVIDRFEDVVFHSSLKFGIGLLVFPIWWGMVFLILSLIVGMNIALLAVIVMVSGLFYSYQR